MSSSSRIVIKDILVLAGKGDQINKLYEFRWIAVILFDVVSGLPFETGLAAIHKLLGVSLFQANRKLFPRQWNNHASCLSFQMKHLSGWFNILGTVWTISLKRESQVHIKTFLQFDHPLHHQELLRNRLKFLILLYWNVPLCLSGRLC